MTKLIVLVGLCAACSAAVVEGEPADSELVIEVADPALGLRATLEVDGEVVAIESHTADGIRALSVTGADGTIYAAWNVTVADHEIVGAFGGHAFGRIETADTDEDPSFWLPVADSRVGEVIAEVSAAAEPLVADGDLDAVREDLENLSWMSGYLERLAGAPDDAVQASCSNMTYFNGWLISRNYYCTVGWTADTRRCGSASPSGPFVVYLRIHNGSTSGSTFAYASDASNGPEAWAWLDKNQSVSRGTTVKKIARHWDNRGFSRWSALDTVVCPL